jgi:hypothetical protein
MDGHTGYPVKGFKAQHYIGTLGFQPNGSSTPSTSTMVGTLKGRATVTVNAAGELHVTFAAGITFPERPVFQVHAQAADGSTNRAYAHAGTWSSSARKLVVWTGQTFGTPANLTNDANCWVHIVVHGVNTTGK